MTRASERPRRTRAVTRAGRPCRPCGDRPPGAAIDTATPGRQTVDVTATDGAGNTTTVTRHYTVRQAPHWPDAMVRRPDSSWLGAGTYGSARRQTAVWRIRRGHEQRVQIALVNRGNRARRCVVDGTSGNRAFDVTYLVDGRDVTLPIERGTWRTPSTAPGARQVLVASIEIGKLVDHGRKRTFVVSCTSTSDPTHTDAVGVRAVVR